jgi:hypothetical protein
VAVAAAAALAAAVVVVVVVVVLVLVLVLVVSGFIGRQGGWTGAMPASKSAAGSSWLAAASPWAA